MANIGRREIRAAHGKKTTPRAAARREQILKAATHVFARENYHGATTAKIAAAAGITEPVIYTYFANKRDLFLEVLRKSRADIFTWNEEVLREHDDPIQRYKVYTDKYKHYVTKVNRDSAMMWAVAASVNDPEIKAEIRESDEEVLNQLTNDIRRTMEEGKITSRHAPQVLARIIHGVNSHLAWLILVGETHTQDWIYEGFKILIEDLVKKEV
ncbi:MAG: TetR/AcrR family transcriptional regulator [Candidatus Abyssobacteria bacterium SURF_5]|uniref:TetR/AcrR family transcriptional regulator n=1 Tax=Abyssobacteria bacterium (strain SURF_5) TaxID=2093360 RepID=A0A3A4N771_ABYX5|nr:MAG: TetR/AcrR family transcriptional regulator [Candidatus Abyssubacteria bacterium SURF_5]